MNINPETAKDIPCKNVTIYGFCKYEKKGCVFSHNNANLLASSANAKQNNTSSKASLTNNNDHLSKTNKDSVGETGTAKKKFDANTPSFQPSIQSLTNKFSSLSPKLKDLPLFIPASLEQKEEVASPAPQTKKFNASTPSFTPSYETSKRYATPTLPNETQQLVFSPLVHTPSTTIGPPLHQEPPRPNPYLPGPAQSPVTNMGSMNSGLATDMMYSGIQSASTYALNHHLYAPAPPPRLNLLKSEHQTNINDMFIPNDLREELLKKNAATLQTLALLTLPDHVGEYHSLVPMDTTFTQPSAVYGFPSYVYKAMSNVDGNPYAIRRIDFNSEVHYSQELKIHKIKKWLKLKNPNIVRVHDAFTTVAFGNYGEPVLCVVSDYFPLANTLQENHITRKLGGKLEPVTETLLWSYLVQITNAIMHIHNNKLAAGSSLAISKILVTNKGRVRLGGVGVDDALNSNDTDRYEEVLSAQQKDLTLFRDVMFELIKVSLPQSLRNESCEKILSQLSRLPTVNFSDELINTLDALCSLGEELTLTDFFTEYLAIRSLEVLSGLEDLTDYMESQLTSELENGRLFRLMAKIDLLVNLPEKDRAEIGSFFVIKLFHQFVFNSYDELGKPVVDLSKILVNLNKLDAGVDEKILLISSEEDSCIIVSYREVKNVIELTFRGVFR